MIDASSMSVIVTDIIAPLSGAAAGVAIAFALGGKIVRWFLDMAFNGRFRI